MTEDKQPESTEEDQAEILRREVAVLNNADDGQWTKDGLPDCNVLKERCGFAVTRKMLTEVAPDAKRQSAPRQASLAECNAMVAKHTALAAEKQA